MGQFTGCRKKNYLIFSNDAAKNELNHGEHGGKTRKINLKNLRALRVLRGNKLINAAVGKKPVL